MGCGGSQEGAVTSRTWDWLNVEKREKTVVDTNMGHGFWSTSRHVLVTSGGTDLYYLLSREENKGLQVCQKYIGSFHFLQSVCPCIVFLCDF